MNGYLRTRAQLLVIFLIVFGAAVSGSVWIHQFARGRLQETQRALGATTAAISHLRAEIARLNQQLQSAEQDRAALGAASGEKEDSAYESEIKPWLAQLKQLKQLFSQRGDQRIPELQFLNDRDWLLIGRAAKLDTDEHIREAMAKARNDARWIFARRMVDAFSKYKKSHDNELPPSMGVLAPFFDGPVDESILERYEIVSSGKVQPGRAGAVPAIREKAPVDSEYDSRIRINANGGMTSGSPLDWVAGFDERRIEAYRKYAQENSGASPQDMASLLPYFSPALDPATRAKVLRLDRKK